ncbi:MAG: hypothetical protein LBT44_07275 [Clostridiales bacterium]|nr:hypothetical protein [Clostridiales bacterium]
MAYARPRKHYRVAENARLENMEEGIFITEEQQCVIGALGIFLMLLVLIESIIVYALVRGEDE